jgi:hypothetical protein
MMRNPIKVAGAIYRRARNADDGVLTDAILSVERLDEDSVQIVADDVKGATVMVEMNLNSGEEIVQQLRDAIREDWHG